MAVKKGDKIKVEYTGTLKDGTVFDSSEKHGQPLEFEVGAGQLIKGFDEAVIGMEQGEEKEITIEPADAYGEKKDELVRELPKEQFPKDQEIKEGMFLAVGLPDGKQLPAQVVGVGDDTITLDMNHPLAGKELHFKLKVVDVEA